MASRRPGSNLPISLEGFYVLIRPCVETLGATSQLPQLLSGVGCREIVFDGPGEQRGNMPETEVLASSRSRRKMSIPCIWHGRPRLLIMASRRPRLLFETASCIFPRRTMACWRWMQLTESCFGKFISALRYGSGCWRQPLQMRRFPPAPLTGDGSSSVSTLLARKLGARIVSSQRLHFLRL
jgi:hypothetical protein